MSSLDLSALRSAIQSLDDGVSVVSDVDWFKKQNDKVQHTLIAGVIQNFEFVYEISIKMIRRQLEIEADSASEIDQASFRDVLRIAAEKGLIADVEAWLRILTKTPTCSDSNPTGDSDAMPARRSGLSPPPKDGEFQVFPVTST